LETLAFNVPLHEQFLRALRMPTKLPIIHGLRNFDALAGLNDIPLRAAKIAVTVSDVDSGRLRVLQRLPSELRSIRACK
jgi:hypothetical protein